MKIKYFKSLVFRKEYLYLLLFLILGLILRRYFNYLSRDLYYWDSVAYNYQAKDMMKGTWGVEYNDHNSGYGFFLFLVYSIFGRENSPMVYLSQTVLDLLIALIIYGIVKKVFSSKAGLIATAIYLVNPITASYTGLMLPEIVTMFYIISLAGILVTKSFTASKKLWFLSGLILGLILFTRMSFLYFAFVFILLGSFMFFHGRRRIFFIMICLLGFILSSGYSLLGYYQKYRIVSLVPPYNIGIGAMYMNFYNNRYPELVKDYPQGVSPTYYEINREYHTSYFLDIPKFREKYSMLFWEKIRHDWPIFMRNSLRNIFWMWDKEHLFAYADPFYPRDKWPLRIGNICVFILALIGLVKGVRENRKQPEIKRLAIFSFTLFFYMTFFFSLVTNETRHTVCFYPILILWAGYGLYLLLGKMKDRIGIK